MKYPIGIQSFEQIIEDGYVYIDKTSLIYKLTHEGSVYFLSRPRRFGKSLLISTLAAYFGGRKELFKRLAIINLEKDWFQYPIFRIDFNGGDYTKKGILEKTIESYLANWESIYGKNPIYNTTGDRFKEVLRRAHEQTGKRAVVLIDEYDKPVLDVLDTEHSNLNRRDDKSSLRNEHCNILKAFYSTFKGSGEHLKFVLLTGVTTFSQESIFSGFNQSKDISMDRRYEGLCGITQQELEDYFTQPITELADIEQYTVEEMKIRLKQRYAGYHFGEKMIDIYNPFNILNVFDSMAIRNYWFSTGDPTYLLWLLQHNHEQINELTGKYYKSSMFVDYKAEIEKPLPMIYQSGYLTIKEYNRRMETYLLDFPNNEVREGFLSLIAARYLKPQNEDVTNWVADSVLLLRQGETDEFCHSLTAFLSSIPYDSHEALKDLKMTEKHFQYTFYLLLRLMGVYCQAIHCEDRHSYGRVDCILEMKDYVYIFEFKMDGTPQEALAQIEKMGYARPYSADPRKVICIGMNFSSTTRTIEDWAVQENC